VHQSPSCVTSSDHILMQYPHHERTCYSKRTKGTHTNQYCPSSDLFPLIKRAACSHATYDHSLCLCRTNMPEIIAGKLVQNALTLPTSCIWGDPRRTLWTPRGRRSRRWRCRRRCRLCWYWRCWRRCGQVRVQSPYTCDCLTKHSDDVWGTL
jgi:hypothetical protein